MERKTVTIPNISCEHCIRSIQREVGELAGVSAVEGDPDTKSVTIVWDQPADWKGIEELLEEIGYPPE